MTNVEKDRFCSFTAALLAPPDETMVGDLRQDALHAQLDEYVREWGGDGSLLAPFFDELKSDDSLSVLQEEYARLFVQYEGDKVSLVESAYKPWTVDKACGMVFAASKGLVMGDHAVHMLELYQQVSLEVPEEFRSTPDHLVLELEFLAHLYRFASHEQISRFIEDHLNWIPELKGEMEKVNPHPFYRSAVELIHRFLQNETKNGKVKAHG